jgi:hypothetical protein
MSTWLHSASFIYHSPTNNPNNTAGEETPWRRTI